MTRKVEPMKANETWMRIALESQARTVDQRAFLRELVQNSIEAVATRIRVDIHWPILEREGIYRLCVIDNGYGMDANALEFHLNNLGNSDKAMSIEGNYGQGARATTLFRNPAGVEYFSWQDGRLCRAKLVWSENGIGMEYLTSEDVIEDLTHEQEFYNAWPEIIQEHGTVVVLHGETGKEHTFLMNDSVKHWGVQYLQSRYYSLPKDVSIRCNILTTNNQSQWPQERAHKNDTATWHNYSRPVVPHEDTLMDMASDLGTVRVRGATIAWFILDEDVMSKLTRQNRYGITKAHTAAIHKNELFDLTDARSKERHEFFGITAGYKRFAIIAIPDEGMVLETLQRSHLIWSETGGALPWEEWGADFREVMPEEVKQFVLNERDKAFEKRTTFRNNRLADYARKFGIANFKSDKQGAHSAEGESHRNEYSHGDAGKRGENEPDNKSPILSRETPTGIPARRQNLHIGDLPEVQWIIDQDVYDIGFAAAHYVEGENIVYADPNYEALNRWRQALSAELENRCISSELRIKAVEVAVRACAEWCFQGKVLSTRRIFGNPGTSPWNSGDVKEELSDRAFTATLGDMWIFFEMGTEVALEEYKTLEKESIIDEFEEIAEAQFDSGEKS